jgi:FkbM family methyltransferase
MIFNRIRNKALSLFRLQSKTTYSQCGEDVIVEFALSLFKKTAPSYLDIGAHHPTHLSNTRLLYGRGGKGVCVEPNPVLCDNFQKRRPKDICLNIGISPDQKVKPLSFYILNDLSLSTFSKEVAENITSDGVHSITETREVACFPVNHIIAKYFDPCPDFVSLDTEGLDLQILQSFDFASYRPLLFCIETLDYSTHTKMHDVIQLMSENNYQAYADTFVNTIFIDSDKLNEWLHEWRMAHG